MKSQGEIIKLGLSIGDRCDRAKGMLQSWNGPFHSRYGMVNPAAKQQKILDKIMFYH